MIKGSYVALVTPFNIDGSVNYDKIRELIEYHISNETDGIVLIGTTGEATGSWALNYATLEEAVTALKTQINGIGATNNGAFDALGGNSPMGTTLRLASLWW